MKMPSRTHRPATDRAEGAAPRRRPGRVPPAAIVRRHLPIPAEEAWELMTDVRNHARWIPFTRIEAPAHLGVGAEFHALSGPPGPAWLSLPDRMVVTRSDPPRPSGGAAPGEPGAAVYRKLGPVLLGTAEVHVRSTGPGSSEVAWVERVHLRGLPVGLTAPVLRPFLAAMTRLALQRAVREVEQGRQQQPGRWLTG